MRLKKLDKFKKVLFYDGWGKEGKYYLNQVFTVEDDDDIQEIFRSIYHETGDTFIWKGDEQVRPWDVLTYDKNTDDILRVETSDMDYDYPSYYGFEIISYQEYAKRLSDEKKELDFKINAEAKLFYESL